MLPLGCFRPAGLVFNPTGENLYVTSDTSGEVVMLKRNIGPVFNPGASNPGPTTTQIPTTTSNPTTSIPSTTSPAPSGPQQTMYGQWCVILYTLVLGLGLTRYFARAAEVLAILVLLNVLPVPNAKL